MLPKKEPIAGYVHMHAQNIRCALACACGRARHGRSGTFLLQCAPQITSRKDGRLGECRASLRQGPGACEELLDGKLVAVPSRIRAIADISSTPARPSHGTAGAQILHQIFFCQMEKTRSEGAKTAEKRWCALKISAFL